MKIKVRFFTKPGDELTFILNNIKNLFVSCVDFEEFSINLKNSITIKEILKKGGAIIVEFDTSSGKISMVDVIESSCK